MRRSEFIEKHLESNAPIAQLVEQIPLKDKVVGSIPTGRTAKNRPGWRNW